MTTKIPAELSSTPGIADSSNATAITIDSSEKVGIGAAPTLGALHVTSSLTDIVTFENTDAGTTGAQLILYHNSSSPADGDRVGALNFKGQDDAGNDTTYAGIRCLATDVSNTTEDGTLTFSTTRAGTFTEAMRIDESGKVGIGITSFDEGVLHVKSDDSGEVELLSLENSTGTNGKATLTFKTTSTDSTKSAQIFAERINASGHTDLAFRTFNGSTTERMRIDSEGRFGFHATYPPTSAQFMRIEEELSSNRVMRISNRDNGAGGKTMEIGHADNNQGASIITAFHGNNVSGSSGDPFLDAVFDLQVNGSISIDGTLSEGSDRRLKKDIANSTYGLAAINQLIPRTYKHRDVSKEMIGTQIGFIADEVESVIPEVVSKFGLKADGSTLPKIITGYGDEAGTEETFDNVKTLNYERLVVVLTKALQEADDKIEALTARIETLEE